MCHPSVLTWAGSLSPDLVADRTICEVGSYDVNGSVRPTLAAHGPTSYVGVDQTPGPGVDVVADVADLPELYPAGFDVVITTEMLEHVEDWRAAMYGLVALVKVGGHLALTTRSPGFPYHPFPIDCWRYPVDTMREILTALGLEVVSCVDDPEAPGVFAVNKKTKTTNHKKKDPLAAIEVPGV